MAISHLHDWNEIFKIVHDTKQTIDEFVGSGLGGIHTRKLKGSFDTTVHVKRTRSTLRSQDVDFIEVDKVPINCHDNPTSISFLLYPREGQMPTTIIQRNEMIAKRCEKQKMDCQNAYYCIDCLFGMWNLL